MLKLFRFLKPYKWAIAGVIIFVFAQTMSDLYLPTLMADIINNGVTQGDTDYIRRIGVFMLLVSAIGMICAIISSYLSAKVGVGFGKIVRNKVFSHVEKFSLQEFDQVGTASLITRTTNDINQVQNVLIMMLRIMVMAPMMAIGGVIMAVSKDAKLSLILVVAIPILVIAIIVIAKKGMPLFKVMQVKIDHLNKVLREGLTGVRVIRSFNKVDYEKERFQEANFDLTNTAEKVNKIMAAMMPFMMIVMNLTSVAIIWFGGIRIDNGNMAVGDMMAFIQYATQIMFSVLMASMMFVMVPRASASAIRLNEVLDIKPKINDASETKKAGEVRGDIEFKDVTFYYPGAEKPAVEGISFHARAGETTAIIGGTGSGKSTLMNLIPRFYDIDKGSIVVDNVDIRQLSQGDLREKIGYVPQKAVLFTGTIEENIRYGKEEATMEEIEHAATVAQAADFIADMEDGYQSAIAQGGTNVSGGQKQRLSIARALVRQPEIYIFDDSFSALDFKTDAKLRMALQSETTEATVLIVAQRVSTVMNADRIIVLEDGKVAGIGTHKELLETSEVYRELVASQLSEEEIA